MNRVKKTNLFALFATSVLLSSILLPSFTTPAQADNTAPDKTTAASKKSKVTFKSRKGQPAPKVTIGGGRRDNGMCSQSGDVDSLGVKNQTLDKTLVPLLPSSKLGLTASSHPSFMVYVPPTSAKALEFTLENEEGEGIYQTEVNVEKTPGIISFTLPSSEPALETGKDYRFIVSIICQQTGPKNPFVEGLVRRIPSDSKLVNTTSQPKSLEQVILYSNSGYWFEAVGDLAALKLAQPNNLEVNAAWESLLTSVGLDAIANAQLQPSSQN
ncbi:MAG: DUF928 domain-containing protein [Cyanobacteria bacterium P01_A01_bin.80]